MVFGGEELKPSLVKGWREGERRPRLVNMYGITETTVHVTYRPVGLGDLATSYRSPIGEAIPDLESRLDVKLAFMEGRVQPRNRVRRPLRRARAPHAASGRSGAGSKPSPA